MQLDTLFELLSGLSRDGLQVAVNSLWLGLALAGLAWTLWNLARNRDAALSYAAWWMVLVAVIVSPFLLSVSAGLPSMGDIMSYPGTTSTAILEGPIDEVSPVVSTVGVQPAPVLVDPFPAAQWSRPRPEIVSEPPVNDFSWGAILLALTPISLLGIWLCASLTLLGRLGRAFLYMSRIKRTARPMPAELAQRARQLISDTGFSRPVRIGISDRVGFPMAAGLGDPTILIPADLIGHLTPAELDAVILHELAHLRRWDDWTKLSQRLIEALVFFNPAVHWIGRRLDHERELACDDRVLAHTGQPTDYARCLTKLAELNTVGRGLLVPGALVNRKFIFRRLDRVLSSDTASNRRSSRLRMVAAVATTMTALAAIVQVTPAVTLPFDAVSYDELSDNVGSLVGGMAAVDEPAAAEDTEESFWTEPGGDASPRTESWSTPQSSSESEGTSESTRSVSWSTPQRSASYYRVVDWNDDAFDLLITGVIHSDEGPDYDLIAWASDNGRIQAAMRGRLEVDPSDLTLKNIYNGGFLAIRDFMGDSRRELDVRSDGDGNLIYEYYEGGWAAKFDRNARNWLAEALAGMVPDMLQSMELLEESEGGTTGVHTYFGYSDIPAHGLIYSTGSGDSPGNYQYVSVFDPSTGIVQTVGGEDPQVSTLTTSYTNGVAQQYMIAHDDASPMLVDLSGDGQYYAAVVDDDDDGDSGGGSRRSRSIVGQAANWIEEAWDGSWQGTSITRGDYGLTEITINDGRNRVKIEYEGEIEFAEDDGDIESMSDDAYFYLADKRGRHEIEIEPDEDGQPKYTYFKNRDEMPFDDDAREWFERRLTYAIRNTGINADGRVDRWYEEGGAKLVLDEIADLERDYARCEHLTALMEHDLSSDEYSEVLEHIGFELDSDYEKAELLMAMADNYPPDPSTVDDYLGVVETIDSDYETRRVLGNLLYEGNVDSQVAARLLRIAGRMDSDYEKAELLVDWADQVSGNPELLASLLEVVSMIDSDYETRRVLSRISIDDDATDETVLAVLRIAGDMESDYEKSELLIQMAPMCRDSEKLEAAYMDAVGDVDSDYETRRILSALSDRRRLTRATTEEMLTLVHHIDSDYEKAEMLIDLSRACESDPTLRSSFVSAAVTLDSDYETKRVLSSLDYDCVDDAELVTEIMAAVENMSSDYETAELLTDLADCTEDSPEVRTAYIQAILRMSSDYEKSRCLERLTSNRDMDEDLLAELLGAVVSIDGDYEKGELLKELIPQCRGNDRFEDLMVDAIETIDSEYTINELYAKLYRRSTRDTGTD